MLNLSDFLGATSIATGGQAASALWLLTAQDFIDLALGSINHFNFDPTPHHRDSGAQRRPRYDDGNLPL